MKSPLKQIDQLRAKLLGIEMKLSLAEQDLVEVKNSLLYLRGMEKDLIFNLQLHKDPDMVITMKGFAKSRKQLTQVRTRIRTYQKKEQEVNFKLAKYETMSDECYDKIDEIYDHLENDKKILLFKRRDNGKES